MLALTPPDLQALMLSAKVALTATLVALPFGFAVACLLVFPRWPGKALVDGIINLPLVLPPVVVGYLLLLLFGGKGWLGSLLTAWGMPVVFTWKAAAIASAVVGFPLLVRAIRIGLEGIDLRLLQAARTLGAPWHDTVFSVVLPLSAPSLLAGATLMFARSLGEFGATIIVAGNIPGVTRTIPLAIYDYANTPGGDGPALVLCLVAIVLSLGVLLVSERLNRRLRKGNGHEA